MYLPWIQWVTEPGLAPTMTLPAENQGLRIIDDPTEKPECLGQTLESLLGVEILVNVTKNPRPQSGACS